MDFSYDSDDQGFSLDSYERVLLDGMLGDQMLFVREDGVDLTWSHLTPVLEAIEGNRVPLEFPNYPAGSPGPKDAADALLERGDDKWRGL